MTSPDYSPSDAAFCEIEAVVFDAAGTVITTAGSIDSVYHEVSQKLGGHQSRDQIKERFAAAFTKHTSGHCPDDPLARPETTEAGELRRWNAIVRDTLVDLSSTQIREAFDTLWHYFAAPEAWNIVEGTEATLHGLKRSGLKVLLASNFDSRLHQIVQAKPELEPFEACFVSSEIGFSKPDRRFYDHIASALNTPADRLLMVGDTFENDVLGARSAGWQAIHLSAKVHSSECLTIASLPELLELEFSSKLQ